MPPKRSNSKCSSSKADTPSKEAGNAEPVVKVNHDNYENEEPLWAPKLLGEMVNQMDSKLESKFNTMESGISVRITKIESTILELNDR